MNNLIQSLVIPPGRRRRGRRRGRRRCRGRCSRWPDLSLGLPVFFVPVYRYFEYRYTGTEFFPYPCFPHVHPNFAKILNSNFRISKIFWNLHGLPAIITPLCPGCAQGTKPGFGVFPPAPHQKKNVPNLEWKIHIVLCLPWKLMACSTCITKMKTSYEKSAYCILYAQ